MADAVLGDPCCVCGSPEVIYRNYQQKPFCVECADSSSTTPDPSADPVAVTRAFLGRIDRARKHQLHGWTVDDIPLYPTDAGLPVLTVGIVRRLLAEIDRREG